MAAKLEDLPMYPKAVAFYRAVIAILDAPGLRRDRKLREQIADAADSILANMYEGFEQPTDAAFANYLFHSKASVAEVLGRLRLARLKHYITEEELLLRTNPGEELGRMLGGFIKYLKECDWKDRGRSWKDRDT
jgi:four helix bundle protein